jgi:ABC-type ATPase involved in cell division
VIDASKCGNSSKSDKRDMERAKIMLRNSDPLIILADELTRNLDTRSSEEIISILRELHERGRAIVIIPPEPDMATRAQRVVDRTEERNERLSESVEDCFAQAGQRVLVAREIPIFSPSFLNNF